MKTPPPEDGSSTGYDANGGEFQELVTRDGTPLNYVAEKLRHAVKSAHSTWRSASRFIPDDLPYPSHTVVTDPLLSAKHDTILGPIHNAFTYCLLAYLALMNMVALNDPEKWLAASGEELDAMLKRVAREGSVT